MPLAYSIDLPYPIKYDIAIKITQYQLINRGYMVRLALAMLFEIVTEYIRLVYATFGTISLAERLPLIICIEL